MNFGLIGSTRLTRQVFHFLAARGGIQFAVGLPDDRLSDKADGVPMDSLCAQHGTPLLKPRRLVEAVAEIRRFAPDLILEFGDSRIVPPELLSLPRLGVVGNHGAILPMVKGGASLPWGRMLASGTWVSRSFSWSRKSTAAALSGLRASPFPPTASCAAS